MTTDHADTVRDALHLLGKIMDEDEIPTWERAVRALDVLVAELDEARSQRDYETAKAQAAEAALAEARRERENAQFELRGLDLVRQKDNGYLIARAEAAEADRDTLAAAAKRVTDAFTAESEDWNDGEFALWHKDDLINAIVALRAALASVSPPTQQDPAA